MALEEGVAPNVEEQNIEERHVNISGLFCRPEKYRIGEDFDLFFRKSVLYFDAIDLADERKKRLALLFNLSEDAFRLAEGVPLPECQNSFDAWGKEIATRFEKNQTATERRYTFSKRIQLPGETVDAYSVSLRALAAKCDFRGSDYNNRVLDQFILGLQDKGTQNRLLQEPPSTVDEAIAVARRYEAARSTLDTLKHENLSRSSVVNPVRSGKTCFVCHNPGHVARDCTHERYNVEKVSPNNKLCFYCKQTGHIQHHCPFTYNRDRFRNTTEQERPREERICFRCNKRGHVAKYCRANWEEINSGLSSRQPLSKEQGRNVSKLSSIAGSEKRTTLVLEGVIEGSRVLCVLDTGASICLMSKEKWNKLSLSKELLPSDVVAEAANNMPLGILGRSILQFECAGIGFEQEFYIVEHMAHEILIGLNWMLENKVDLQVGARKLLFGNGNSCDLFLYDSSFMHPGVVSLCEDLEVPAVSDWLERGLVGRPKYDPRTHEIRADPVVTSDVTRQRMNIPRNASEKSRLYHTELDEIIRQRDEHRKNDSVQQRQQSVEGVENERASTIRTRQIEQLSADTSQVLPFGRPGAGAPNRTESGKIKAKLSSDKQKKAYDERFRTGKSKRLMPGDTVMLLDNTARGLSEKYIGPFMIVDIVNSNCQIRSLLNGKEKRVHYNRLKPFELALDEALLQESASVVTSDWESSDSENKEDHVIIHRRDRRNDFVLPDDMQRNSREPEITFVERADENIVDLPNAASKRTSTRSRRPVERYGVSVTDY